MDGDSNLCRQCKVDRRQCRCCCNSECSYLDQDDAPEGPCEGPVSAVDEELIYGEDGHIEDSYWVHRCEKHAKLYYQRGY